MTWPQLKAYVGVAGTCVVLGVLLPLVVVQAAWDLWRGRDPYQRRYPQ
jgi:hypothetical protein